MPIVLPVGAGRDDVDHNNAGISCGFCSISKAVRINRLEQDGIIALGYALLNLADLGSSVLISTQDGQVNAQLVSLGLSSPRIRQSGMRWSGAAG